MNRGIDHQRDGRRRCARCGLSRPLSAFPPDRTLQDGLGSWCRACHVTVTREWRATHRQTNNAKKRKAYRARRDEILARRRELYAMRTA